MLETNILLPRAEPFMPLSFGRLKILYKDNHLLVINKPAMLPTMGVASDKESLLSLAKEYIRQKHNKPGKVYLGVVSRLDAPVTGVVLVARTSKSAARLSEAFRQRQVQKIYWAVVAGIPDKSHGGTLEHFIRKDERHRRVHVTHENNPDAQFARLHFSVLSKHRDHSLLRIELETGRKHQIRVQLAKIGHPILGDFKYGSELKFPDGIALHAQRLELEHPVRKETIEFEAPLPKCWRKHRLTTALLSSC